MSAGKTKGKQEGDNKKPRPEYDRKAIMEQICTLMAEGQSLRRICAAVEGMPKHSTVCGWMLEDKELSDQYARARDLLADYRFDEYRDASAEVVAQYIREGWEPKDAVAMAKLVTGNMQWELSKLAPKKYGDKLELDNKHSGDLTLSGVLRVPSITAEQWAEMASTGKP